MNDTRFGEVTSRDVTIVLKIFNTTTDIFYDVGMGRGKFILQAFEERPEINLFVGIELLADRYNA